MNDNDGFGLGVVCGALIMAIASLCVGDVVTPAQYEEATRQCVDNEGLSRIDTTQFVDHIEYLCNNGVHGDAPVARRE